MPTAIIDINQEITFTDQIVVITGAGRGLGRAYAHGFAVRGAHVVVHDAGVRQDGSGYDRSVADSVVSEIRSAGGSASASYYDIAAKDGCDQLVEDTVNAFGRLDVLVSNAGIVRFIPDQVMTELDAIEMLSVNALASLWLTIAVKRHMLDQRYGRIIYTVSGYGTSPADEPNELTAYGMAKAAVFGIMNISAGEFSDADVCLNAISPVAATRILRRPVSGDEFAPEKVVPAVLLLGSQAWRSSGFIVTAADGRFALRRIVTEHPLSTGAHDGAPEALQTFWGNEIS